MSGLERKITHYPNGTLRKPRKRIIGERGSFKRRIIFEETRDKGTRYPREFQFHATKGCRSYRVPA